MFIDEKISCQLAEKPEIWLDYLQENTNDEDSIEYTRIVLENNYCSVCVKQELRLSYNESNIDKDGIGSAYEEFPIPEYVIERIGIEDYNETETEAYGNGNTYQDNVRGIDSLYEAQPFRDITRNNNDFYTLRDIFNGKGNGSYDYPHVGKLISNLYCWGQATVIY